MSRTTGTMKKMAVLAALTLACATPLLAQDAQPVVGRSKRTVLVSIPDRRLAVLEGGLVIGTFPVAVGKTSTPSPTGEFEIVNRVANPTYYHSGKIIPTGKDNPLGTRWIGLARKAMASMVRTRQRRWDRLRRTAASVCGIATPKSYSPCCKSEM